MSVLVPCAACHRVARVADAFLGKVVRCPYCFDTFTAEAARRPEPEPIVEEARVEVLDEPIEAVSSYSTGVPVTAPLPAPAYASATAPIVETPPALPAGEAFPPIRFIVLITRDPDQALKGRLLGVISAEGLRLRQPDGSGEVCIPRGSPARYLGVNRLAVTIEGREVQMLLFKSSSNQDRLTRDVAQFLNGQRRALNRYDYMATWYVTATALLVLGLPLLAWPCRLVVDLTGLILWSGLAIALAVAGLIAATRSRRHPGLRFMAAATLTLSGYAILTGAVMLGFARPSSLPDSSWQSFTSPDVGYSVSFPGRPQSHLQTLGRHTHKVWVVERPDYHVTFSAHYVDLAIAGLPFNDPESVFNERQRAYVTELGGHRVIRQAALKLAGRYPGRELVLLGGGYPREQRTVLHLYLVREKLFILSMAGPDVSPESKDARRFFGSFFYNDPMPAAP